MTTERDLTSSQLCAIAPNATPLRPDDAALIQSQLGRVPRGLVAIGARCACGRPAVTITAPRLADGSPFPTLFYMTLPYLVKAMSRLEASGVMTGMNEDLISDLQLAAAHARAHADYITRRRILDDVPEIANVSAGGMPDRVKCLHALGAYALSVGAGICVMGDRALEAIEWDATVCHCDDAAGA